MCPRCDGLIVVPREAETQPAAPAEPAEEAPPDPAAEAPAEPAAPAEAAPQAEAPEEESVAYGKFYTILWTSVNNICFCTNAAT